MVLMKLAVIGAFSAVASVLKTRAVLQFNPPSAVLPAFMFQPSGSHRSKLAYSRVQVSSLSGSRPQSSRAQVDSGQRRRD